MSGSEEHRPPGEIDSLSDPLDRLDARLAAGTHYTGVGSRETPADVQALMTSIARRFAALGLVLRSGGAGGADSAFEAGAGAAREILLPFKGFRGHDSGLVRIDERAFERAAAVHPAWSRCNDFARRAHARNVHQVMGEHLDSPSALLVCWTRDGCTNAANSRDTGGTRTAIVLAAEAGVPVINLQRPAHRALLERWLQREPAPAPRAARLG